MNFRIGQRVVCIHEFRKHTAGYIKPIKNQIYTIREIHPPSITGSDRYGILLEELVNPPRKYKGGRFGETGFYTNRFRPLIEKKTDIAIFTAMLKPTKELV